MYKERMLKSITLSDRRKQDRINNGECDLCSFGVNSLNPRFNALILQEHIKACHINGWRIKTSRRKKAL